MTGLMLLGAAVIWLFVAIRLARWLSRTIHIRPSVQPFASIALAILIFFLPVADELAARPYFEALCHKGAVLRIDATKIRGKSVTLTVEPLNEQVNGGIIPIFRSHFLYRDAATGDVLAEFETYTADGGVLARTLKFAGSHPWTGTFYCAPAERTSMKTRYGFVVLN